MVRLVHFFAKTILFVTFARYIYSVGRGGGAWDAEKFKKDMYIYLYCCC